MSENPDQLWRRALDQLRDFGGQVPANADDTRRRVLRSAGKRAPRPWRGFALALGLCLTGGSALAYFTGGPGSWTAAVQALLSGPLHEARMPGSGAEAPGRRAVEPRPVEQPRVEQPTGVTAQLEPAGTPRQALRPAEAEMTRRPRSRARPAAEGAERAHALYLDAHRLHFGAGPPVQALRAWERYLQASPHGSFAVEARYNRAIALIRLERYQAALTALAPFACAAADGYRQREAELLITRLRRKSPSLPPLDCASAPESEP